MSSWINPEVEALLTRYQALSAKEQATVLQSFIGGLLIRLPSELPRSIMDLIDRSLDSVEHGR